MAGKLGSPRVFLVDAAGRRGATQSTIDTLLGLCAPGDIIIDGGNAFYKDDIRRAKACTAKSRCITSTSVLPAVCGPRAWLLHDDWRRQERR